MLNKLRDILNTYTKEELEDMDLWIDSHLKIESIIVEEYDINLVSDEAKVIINDVIDKEGSHNEKSE